METTYHVDPQWVLDRPGKIAHARIVTTILTISVILVSIFLGEWLVLVAATPGVVYWLVELLPGKIKYKNLYIQVLDEGLFQSAPSSNKEKPATMLTPWSYLIIDGVKRKAGVVKTIRLIDTTLPKGVRTIKVENLERMNSLLSEIKNRLSVDSA